ncbi:Retrovirus-related Pol poly from transposon, partial [Paramuricea clavata]
MATPNLSLPNFPPFDVHVDGNVGPRWKKWLTRQDYKEAVDALNAYFLPQVNSTFEEYNFRQAKQQHGENIDAYNTRLRQLAQTCDFTDVDKEVKSQIIIGCLSQRLRRQALRDNPTLKDLLAAGRAQERSEAQAEAVEKGVSPVNSIKHEQSQRDTRKYQQSKSRYFGNAGNQQTLPRNRQFPTRNRQIPPGNQQIPTQQCRNCGGIFPHNGDCPAKGKECRACGKSGHFAKVCRSKPKRREIHQVSETPSEEPQYLFTLQNNHQHNTSPLCEVYIANEAVQTIIDSGASVNVIDESTYEKIRKRSKNAVLTTPRSKIFTYGSNMELPLLGMTTPLVYTLHCNLLRYQRTKWKPFELQHCPKLRDPKNNYLFDGIGKIKDKKVKLHIDPEIQPKQQSHRRIPFHIRKDVEKELQRLEDLDVIEGVEGPTPWVSPIVVVPKKTGEIRLCVDMREANKAVKREKHLIPTLDELITDLNDATVFSTLDLTSGYHQLELEPESRHITTFSTHVGLRRYKRLMFGINAASEIFQNSIAELLTHLPGCKNISDDIIVYGRDVREHDENLNRVSTRLREHNARLNRDKCAFRKSEVIFYGHSFSAEGIKAAPQKINAIKTMQPPENPSEVKSLLGMAQYVSRFIPNYATITAPLRALTHQNSVWKWEIEEETAFRKLQNELTSDRVMAYFDPTKSTKVLVDASPTGLGAILMQDGKVISYGSRALTDVESRYSQTEREMLAVVWATEHYHLYLYGAKFTLITDHKPLLGIFKSHRPTSPRIDRWKLRLMPYHHEIIYRPGKDDANPADFISRHPDKTTPFPDNIAENYVNYLCNNVTPKAMTMSE